MQAAIRINLAALDNTVREAAGDWLEAAYRDIGALPRDAEAKTLCCSRWVIVPSSGKMPS